MPAYLGMDAATGRRLSDVDHLSQSVGKVLGTAIGTRLRRRAFGARAADLIDAPLNGVAILQLYTAAATALMRWEPRVKVRRVVLDIDSARAGRATLYVYGERIAGLSSQPFTTTVPLSY
ncbi:Phage baseplate assembly protein [plant metagenome]|uniref:Phage baseplate assembly protein n=1 Tax=plant metagenome TaxID=1297885 RepID=A0A484QPB5_9ZZZZ